MDLPAKTEIPCDCHECVVSDLSRSTEGGNEDGTEDAGRTGDELVRALDRWQSSGAVWRVTQRRLSGVTVALLRCDGGEEVEQLTSDAPSWLTFLDGRDSSED